MGESLTEFYPKTQLELVTYKQHNLPLQTQLLYSVQGLSTFNANGHCCVVILISARTTWVCFLSNVILAMAASISEKQDS